MNERIQELAEQAGAVQYGVDYQHDAYPINLEELKKFAELIVRECIGVVEGGSFLHNQAPAAIFAKECSGAIKQHFGVEL